MEMEKVETISELLKAIERKKKTIQSQTKFLKNFNTKLELLLACFKAYSFESDFTETIEKCPTKHIEKEEHKKKIKTNESMEERIEKLSRGDPQLKSILLLVFDVIKDNEPISLDDLVKMIKFSKYKVIEALNILIKDRVVVKSFEKGFVYRTSHSQ
ncbi:hypothetical protein GINT2_001905 [Glugoides intestinalis]